MAFEYLIDTNILLRLSREDDPLHLIAKTALEALNVKGAVLYFGLQNIAEFWNVCTRPVERNGYGLSIIETNRRVEAIERTMSLLPDSDKVYSLWRRLVLENDVRGVQVHDARLATPMQAHAVTHMLTLNQPDFVRYSDLRVVHPSAIGI